MAQNVNIVVDANTAKALRAMGKLKTSVERTGKEASKAKGRFGEIGKGIKDALPGLTKMVTIAGGITAAFQAGRAVLQAMIADMRKAKDLAQGPSASLQDALVGAGLPAGKITGTARDIQGILANRRNRISVERGDANLILDALIRGAGGDIGQEDIFAGIRASADVSTRFGLGDTEKFAEILGRLTQEGIGKGREQIAIAATKTEGGDRLLRALQGRFSRNELGFQDQGKSFLDFINQFPIEKLGQENAKAASLLRAALADLPSGGARQFGLQATDLQVALGRRTREQNRLALDAFGLGEGLEQIEIDTQISESQFGGQTGAERLFFRSVGEFGRFVKGLATGGGAYDYGGANE